MNKLFNNLKNILEEIRMTDPEAFQVRENLVRYIEAQEILKPKHIKSPYLSISIFGFARRATQFVTLVLIFMLTIGTGLAQASQSSLPGEVLYPIKLTTEDIVSFTNTKSENKINWEIERTNRRIEEAAKLAVKEDLDDVKKDTIIKNIQKHTSAISDEVKKLEEESPEEALSAHSNLETSLEVHNEILLAIKEDIKIEKESADPAKEGVIEEINKTEENIDEIIQITSVEKDLAKENKEKTKTEIVEKDENPDPEKIVESEESKLNKIANLEAKIAKVEKEILESKKIVPTETPEEITPEVEQTGKETAEIPVEEVPATDSPVEEPAEVISDEATTLLNDTEINAVEEVVETSIATLKMLETDGTETQEETAPVEEIITETEGVQVEQANDNEEVLPIEEGEPEILIEEIAPTTEEIESITEIEEMKQRVAGHLELKQYGRAIILLEEIYQKLSKQVLREKVEEEVKEKISMQEPAENLTEETTEEDNVTDEVLQVEEIGNVNAKLEEVSETEQI